VQLTHPRGGEATARRFYGELLGLVELAKPAELEGRGGVWFQAGDVQLHFGVEDLSPPSRRHIALEVEDLEAVRRRLEADGRPIESAVPLKDMDRFYTQDPFGACIELLSLQTACG